MFGMSLGEIFVIAIIAILFVGPEKLPDALVKIAKFFRSFKSTINEAKESFDRELQIKELKEEALTYKKQLQASVADVRDTGGLDKLDDIYEEFNSLGNSISNDMDDFSEEKNKDEDNKKLEKKSKKQDEKIEDKDV